MIDVCVVTYRNEATIEPLIQSVRRELPAAGILVCDNSPDDGTRSVLRREATKAGTTLRLLPPAGNIGFGAACNRLAQASGEPWLVFLNPDAQLDQFDVDLGAVPSAALVGAVVHLEDGAPQVTFGTTRTLLEEVRIRLLRLPTRRPRIPDNGAQEVGFVSGAAFLVRRSDMLRWGGFDAGRYFMYYEDHDLCRRVRAGGGQVLVDDRFRVRHVGGYSAARQRGLALRRSYDSALAYHRRWSRLSWLFPVVCAVEAIAKIIVGLPRGRLGRTTTADQWSLLGHIVSGPRGWGHADAR
ncbi:MAG TPA: glycosyltransferase [Dermatophilaceae bacterium]|nr:glycosyltransferase [Dermatophilaceae bacterium]